MTPAFAVAVKFKKCLWGKEVPSDSKIKAGDVMRPLVQKGLYLNEKCLAHYSAVVCGWWYTQRGEQELA